ncbi:hypothetical protein BH09MYX1_BH09MYX1_21010 [soil metagenome]
MRALWLSGAALGVLVLISCAKRDEPAWTKLPEQGTKGDLTVTGDPAPVKRFATAPTIDGKLDEPAWTDAIVLGPLVDPGAGGDDRASRVAAYGKLGWDDKNLYVGMVVRDDSPVSPFSRDDADPHLWEKSSAIELMIQPGDPGDNKDYYEIQIDTHGAVFDTHWDDYNIPISGGETDKVFGHPTWSSNAERASTVDTGRSYTIEAAIPFSAFVAGRTALPPKSGDVWRVNLYSFRDAQGIALAWSPIKHQGNFHKSARFGRVKFQ